MWPARMNVDAQLKVFIYDGSAWLRIGIRHGVRVHHQGYIFIERVRTINCARLEGLYSNPMVGYCCVGPNATDMVICDVLLGTLACNNWKKDEKPDSNCSECGKGTICAFALKMPLW